MKNQTYYTETQIKQLHSRRKHSKYPESLSWYDCFQVQSGKNIEPGNVLPDSEQEMMAMTLEILKKKK